MKREFKVDKLCKDRESVLNELKLGYINLADGLFSLARVNFNMVIHADPTSADAYWGVMLAENEIPREEMLKTSPMQYKDVIKSNEYENAMEYADVEQKKIYLELASEVIKLNEAENY